MVAVVPFSAAAEPPRFSRITLALFEDSGWYLANWTAAPSPLPWASGAGCDFLGSTCQRYRERTPGQTYFCDPQASVQQSPGQAVVTSSCTANYKGFGQCMSHRFASGCAIVFSSAAQLNCLSVSYQYSKCRRHHINP